jgi:pyruvate/2-oxoglutarate dehydrogenase complex dihydrolipoamide dehydrogenase (E3) component
VLIEAHRMGGDCLNTGCVPSKSLLASGHAAHAVRGADRFGIRVAPPSIDFAAVHARIEGVIAGIAPHDSEARFAALGCTVIRAVARFTSPREIEADGQRIRARRFVVAAGSRATVPSLPGIGTVPFLTNETVFDLTECPRHLLVLGGGPIGIELAQAFRRLGAAVTVVERGAILPKDEPEAVAVVRDALRADGVDLRENAAVVGVEAADGGVALRLEGGEPVAGSHLLVAVGRTPNLEGLGLAAAGIEWTPRGITVDSGLRTTNRRVLAIGDVTGGKMFTHVAAYHAGIAIRRAVFGLPAKVDDRALPWATYTDPELAQVGLTEAAARQGGHAVRVLTEPFADNDRARAEGATAGLIKVVLDRRGRILGACIVGAHAGDLIGLWGLAIAQRLKIGAIAGSIAPYPTLGEISKRAAGGFYTPTLFGPRTRWAVGLIQRLLP